jgi:hypothetical protein
MLLGSIRRLAADHRRRASTPSKMPREILRALAIRES